MAATRFVEVTSGSLIIRCRLREVTARLGQNCETPVRVGKQCGVLRSPREFETSSRKLEPAQGLTLGEVKLDETNETLKQQVFFADTLAEVADASDGLLALPRRCAVEDKGEGGLDAAEHQLGTQTLVIVGQFIEQLEGRLEHAVRFAVGRPIQVLLRRQVRELERLRSIVAHQKVMSQLAQVVLELPCVTRLDGMRCALMGSAAPFGQQRVVCNLVGKRVLEGILRTSEGRLLIDELAELKVRQDGPQRFLGLVRNRLGEIESKLLADYSQGLQKILFQRRQAVDARG